MAVFPPPFFAYCCVVVAELEEVACDGKCSEDFWDAFDVWDVGASEELGS